MIVIIGAGISGLTAAKNLEDKDFLILEKEDRCGGLATQYPADGYWFDFGGHYFHFRDKEEIKAYLLQNSRFKVFNRKSKTFLLNRYIPYPLQFHLSYLPAAIREKIRTEMVFRHQVKADNLREFLEVHFGNTLYRLFFHPFLSKYYQVDLRTLAANMERGSIPVPTKEQVEAGLRGKRFSKTGYNPQFYYPVPSLRHFIDLYARELGEKIRFHQEVIEVDCKKKRVKTRDHTIHYDKLLTTMPLNELLKVIKPAELFPSPRQLHHISTLVVNVVLKKKRKRFHWVYLPETRFPFYRVGFYPVHPSPACYLERTVAPGVSIDQDRLVRDILYTLTQLKLIENRNELVYFDSRVIPVSYIIFTKNWSALVPPLLSTLKGFDIYSLGRYGSWNYTSMSDDIKSALQCAQELTLL